ncbi:hypothetical protein LTR66_001418 [Elasticomyces elasticus]|nr:hypothetical protein LTR66_001418 [Elasticomyces elasticus]
MVAGAAIVDVLALILLQRPEAGALELAFIAARNLPDDHPKRVQIIRMLLEAGFHGHVVDQYLVAVARTGPESVIMANVLLVAASVDFNGGEALRECIRTRNMGLLKVLLARKPSTDTLRKAWATASALSDERYQYAIFSELLSHGTRGAPLHEELVLAAGRGEPCLDTCGIATVKFLLASRAVGKRHAAAFVRTARTLNEPALKALTGPQVLTATVNTALKEVSSVEQRWFSLEGLPVVRHLLDYGANGFEVDNAFIKASAALAVDAMNLLCESVPSKEVFTVAFDKATEGDSWYSGKEAIELLLQRGVYKEPVNIALLRAIETFKTETTPVGLIDTFLEYGADVNAMDGMALRSAVRYRDVPLLQKLIKFRPTMDTLTMVMVDVMLIGHEDELVLALIDVLTSDPECSPNLDYASPDNDSPMLLCLQKYGNSKEVVRRMLTLGASMDASVFAYVYDEIHLSTQEMKGRMADVKKELMEYEEDEPVNALVLGLQHSDEREDVPIMLWVLTQVPSDKGLGVTDKVLDILYEYWDPDSINQRTPHSLTLALILASRYCRKSVVEKLLQDKAKVNAKDL